MTPRASGVYRFAVKRSPRETHFIEGDASGRHRHFGALTTSPALLFPNCKHERCPVPLTDRSSMAQRRLRLVELLNGNKMLVSPIFPISWRERRDF